MSIFFDLRILAPAIFVIFLGLLASSNALLWAACLATIPMAIWTLGGKRAYRVLPWLVFINWLPIIGDVVLSEVTGRPLGEGFLGPYQEQAILFSLCAMLAVAFGMRCGCGIAGRLFRPDGSHEEAVGCENVRLVRALWGYFGFVILTPFLTTIAASAGGLAQPILAIGLLKYVFMYMVALIVFETNRNYAFLVLMVVVDMATGMLGFFAAYKQGVFVVLIALASTRRQVGVRTWAFAALAFASVVWISLVWTVIKMEYRSKASEFTSEQKIDWLSQRYLSDSIDYQDAMVRLLGRIGYTTLYSQVIARLDLGAIRNDFNFYTAAVEHVITPRVFFPDKAALDDSKLTTALLGFKIDRKTSIGVGYVAEAHVDFGFPGLLLPVFIIGFLQGAIAKYFMTRSAPVLIREGFAVATLFLTFQFETNIDKSLGGLLIYCLTMGLTFKFGYPLIARWLAATPWRARRADQGNLQQEKCQTIARQLKSPAQN